MVRLIAVAGTLLSLLAGAAMAQIDPEANVQPNTLFVDRPIDARPSALLDDEIEVVDVYQIREGDRLSISVLEDPNLNSTVFVRPDGRFNIPLAGTIEASGRTPEDVAAEIQRRLARDFVTPPNVTVSLVGLGSRSRAGGPSRRADIFMMGEISRTGRFTIQLPMTLMQALAIGGGPGRFAAEQRIQVRRKTEDGAEQVILFDYAALQSGSPTVNDIELADGDIIFVPQRRLFE